MRTVGVLELTTHISEILRQVEEEGEVIEVTNHGEVVARVVPVRPPNGRSDRNSTTWEDIDRLAAEIGKYLPEHVDEVEVINDIRREL